MEHECGYHYGSSRYYCVPMAVDAFNYFAGKARTLEKSVVPSDYGTLNYVTWNPVGVVAEKYVPGDTFDMNSNLDPVISKSHAEHVWGYIKKGKEEGAHLVCGGERFTDPVLVKGTMYRLQSSLM